MWGFVIPPGCIGLWNLERCHGWCCGIETRGLRVYPGVCLVAFVEFGSMIPQNDWLMELANGFIGRVVDRTWDLRKINIGSSACSDNENVRHPVPFALCLLSIAKYVQ